MAEVKLFKRNGTYQDKDGKEKHYTNFYVQCGDQMISVTPTYFENEEGRDPSYLGRKMILSAFAETLPDKDESGEKPKPEKKKPKLETMDDNTQIPL